MTFDVALHSGRVRVRRDADHEHVDGGDVGGGVGVRVEADPSLSAASWWGGVAGLLWRVEEHLGGEALDETERARRAVEATTVTWDADTHTLRVAAPDERTLRSVPLTVTLTAPVVPTLRVRAGAASVQATEPVDEVEIETTGEVDLAETGGRASVRCGAGDIRIGTVRKHLRVHGGAGRIGIDRVLGPIDVHTGAGSVRLGTVHADVAVRLAGGDVEVREAVGGDLELSTGAGSVRVGVRPGVDARLDLRSAVGRARSELPVHADRVGAGETGAAGRDCAGSSDTGVAGPVRLRARSGAGDVTVTRSG